MLRNSSGADKKIINAALKLLQKKGLNDLGIREVCREADVNTGLFNYYFGSKEKFMNVLLEAVYDEFIKKFRTSVPKGKDERDNLKIALCEAVKFISEKIDVLQPLLSDMISGNKKVFDYVVSHFTEHALYIVNSIAALAPNTVVKGHTIPYIVACIVPVVIFPIMFEIILRRNNVKTALGIKLADLRKELYSKEAIEQRVEVALRGVGL